MVRARIAGRSRDQLIVWVKSQKLAPRSDEQSAALDSVYPGWRRTSDNAWEDRFVELQEFFIHHGRMPGQTDGGPARSCRLWLDAQLRLPADNSRRRRILEAFPGWESPDQLWNARFAALAASADRLGRLPSQYEPDDGDRSAGLWLASQRRKKLNARRRAAFDRLVPGWDLTSSKRWESALCFVAAYRSEHHMWPSGGADDPEVALHGKWIQSQRRNVLPGSERAARLDAAVPGWRDRVRAHTNTPELVASLDLAWRSRLDQYAEFVTAEGRQPFAGVTSSIAERSLAHWMMHQRTDLGRRLRDSRVGLLDEHIPGWRPARHPG